MKDWLVLVEDGTIKEEISRLLNIKQQNSIEIKRLKKERGFFNRLRSKITGNNKEYFSDVDKQIKFIKKGQTKLNREVQIHQKQLKKLK